MSRLYTTENQRFSVIRGYRKITLTRNWLILHLPIGELYSNTRIVLQDLHVFKTPTPPRVPSPREISYEDAFTCVQLAALNKQVGII